jgi:hypothetical protein
LAAYLDEPLGRDSTKAIGFMSRLSPEAARITWEGRKGSRKASQAGIHGEKGGSNQAYRLLVCKVYRL